MGNGGDCSLQIEKIDESSTFAFLPELESVWAAISILMNEEKSLDPCREIYGKDRISDWRKKYRFLFECFDTVKKLGPFNMMDYLLDVPIDHFSAGTYRDTVLGNSAEDFIWRQLDLEGLDGANREMIVQAMTDDAALDEVFRWVADECGSFLSFSAFVRQSRRYIVDFFSLVEELQTPSLSDTMEKQTGKIAKMAQHVRGGVLDSDPLAFSQQVMGKTFRNRGPYTEFVFLPSYLMPARCVRYFHTQGEKKRQILFLSLCDSGRRREDTIRTLKAVADGTRYQILSLLAREGPQRGLDIAKKTSIAASTVSHHMEQLKEGGLITEEKVKNAKYYGLNSRNTAAFLDELKKDFMIQE